MMSDEKKLTDDQLNKVSGGTGEVLEIKVEETDYKGTECKTYVKNQEWTILGNDN